MKTTLQSGGTAIYNMIEDNVQLILEDQRKMLEQMNSKIGIGGQIILF